MMPIFEDFKTTSKPPATVYPKCQYCGAELSLSWEVGSARHDCRMTHMNEKLQTKRNRRKKYK